VSQTPTTLAELLQPYNLSLLARRLTAKGFPTSRDRMARMARGLTSPTVRELPALAELLRVDLAELARIVSETAVA
jgi:hypothetical protein